MNTPDLRSNPAISPRSYGSGLRRPDASCGQIWGQARSLGSPEPVNRRPPDLRQRRLSNDSARIEPPGDERVPDRDCFVQRVGPTTAIFPPPHFSAIHLSAIHFSAIPLSSPFAYFCHHRKISCRFFLLAQKRKRKRKKGLNPAGDLFASFSLFRLSPEILCVCTVQGGGFRPLFSLAERTLPKALLGWNGAGLLAITLSGFLAYPLDVQRGNVRADIVMDDIIKSNNDSALEIRR